MSRSGAADRRSHTLANRLVANPGELATIEVTFGGLTARVRGGDKKGVAIAVTGADTDPAVNGVPFGTNSIHFVRDGEVITLGAPHSGLRTYLAVRGGIDVEPVLGSRSYDVMSAIGPLPLRRVTSCLSASTATSSPSWIRHRWPRSRMTCSN